MKVNTIKTINKNGQQCFISSKMKMKVNTNHFPWYKIIGDQMGWKKVSLAECIRKHMCFPIQFASDYKFKWTGSKLIIYSQCTYLASSHTCHRFTKYGTSWVFSCQPWHLQVHVTSTWNVLSNSALKFKLEEYLNRDQNYPRINNQDLLTSLIRIG